MTRSKRLVGAIFTLAIFLAGCGGSDPTELADTNTIDVATIVDSASSGHAGQDGQDGQDAEDHHSEGDEDDHDGHTHAAGVEVDRSLPIPGVTIDVSETDTVGVYDLRVELTDFTVTPDAVEGEPVDNEGHMHLLVDGAKVEPFFELEHTIELEPGEHIVEVELNANDHRPWTVEGARINATVLVDVPGVSDDKGSVADTVVQVVVDSQGDVTSSVGDRVEIEVGSIVRFELIAEAASELHIHGYDLHLFAAAGSSGGTELTADVPGRFEVEIEGSGTFVTELVVS